MDAITTFLCDYGLLGMFVGAFLAGSLVPFSSETLMVGLMVAGIDKWPLVLIATIGNGLGSMLNYYIGSLGRVEWFHRYLHVSPNLLSRAQAFVGSKGAAMGFFCFLPGLGSPIAVCLGLLKSNVLVTSFFVFLGKFVRYVALAYVCDVASSSISL